MSSHTHTCSLYLALVSVTWTLTFNPTRLTTIWRVNMDLVSNYDCCRYLLNLINPCHFNSHHVYLTFLERFIDIHGVTKHEVRIMKKFCVVQILLHLENELVQIKFYLHNPDLFLKKKSRWLELVFGELWFL